MQFSPLDCIGLLVMMLGLAVPVALFAKGTVTVGEGLVGVIERGGRFSRLVYAGRHVLVPGLETLRALVPLQEFIFGAERQEVITRNLSQIDLDVLVHYRIARHPASDGKQKWQEVDEEAVYHAVYSASDWQEATKSEVRATLAEVFSMLDLRTDILEMPRWQDDVSMAVRQKLNDKTRRWGVQVTDVSFRGVEFSQSVKDSLSAEARLKREARLREIEAASLKEVAETLNLSPSEVINWRYVETLREMGKNPQARIVVSPDPFAGEATARIRETDESSDAVAH